MKSPGEVPGSFFLSELILAGVSRIRGRGSLREDFGSRALSSSFPISGSIRGQAFTQAADVRRYAVLWTHWLRQDGASKGSAKYCVSCTTLPLRNSMMLTVYAGRPW